jgi:hypothetical protein
MCVLCGAVFDLDDDERNNSNFFMSCHFAGMKDWCHHRNHVTLFGLLAYISQQRMITSWKPVGHTLLAVSALNIICISGKQCDHLKKKLLVVCYFFV